MAAGILVVEQDEAAARDVAGTLSEMGYGVPAVVHTREAALRALDRHEPDLVLLDIRLAGGDGEAPIVSRIRDRRGVPVVYLVGSADEAALEEMGRHVPHGSVREPYDAGVLRMKIEVALARHRWERGLEASERRYRSLFEENVAGAFRSTPGGEILAANEALARILGYDSPQSLERVPAPSLYADPGDRERMLELLREKGTLANHELRLRRRDGSAVWILANLSLDHTEDGPVITGTALDITGRKQVEAYLEAMAFRDPLTGLANRRALEREAERSLALAARNRRNAALVYLDLGDFKEINDTLGHAAGDTVLSRVARRLEGESRESDLVARLGGDEFAVFLSEVDGPDGAVAGARRFAGTLRRPVEVEDRSVPVRAQFGVALFPEHGESIAELLAAADRAMYGAKHEGENEIRLFDPAAEGRPAGPAEAEPELRRALDEEQLQLHYQPILDVRDGAVTGAEALARWRHAERGLLPAAEFVPAAERAGLAPELDRAMVDRLLDDVEQWPDDVRPAWMCINLSPATLGDEGFRSWLSEALETGWPRGMRLVLDVPEPGATRHPDALAGLLFDLDPLPVSLALDDFGTGPASRGFLERIPAEIVKVDPGPLRRPGEDREPGEMARALAMLGRAAGMRVGLEGVERRAQFERAIEDPPDFVQGHYTGRPVDPERFEERRTGPAG